MIVETAEFIRILDNYSNKTKDIVINIMTVISENNALLKKLRSKKLTLYLVFDKSSIYVNAIMCDKEALFDIDSNKNYIASEAFNLLKKYSH